MKKNKNLKSFIWITSITAILLITFFSACSRKEVSDFDGPIPLGKEAILSVSIAGIEDPTEKEMESKAKAGRVMIKGQSLKPQVNTAEGSLYELPEFDAFVQSTSGSISDNKKLKIGFDRSSNSSGSNKAEAKPMDNLVTYQILLYNPDGSLFKSVQAKSNQKLAIEVWKGIEYNWYAYSYNETADMPALNNAANPTIESSISKDLLYANGTVKVDGAGNIEKPLTILFKHKVSNIVIELNAQGLFAGLNTVQATFAGNYFKKGTLDIKTGNMTNLTTVTTGPLNFFRTHDDYKDTIKRVSYFTADEAAINNFTFNLNSFTLALDRGDTRTFTTTTSYPFTVVPTHGTRLTGTVVMVESALSIANTRWARANLYFSDADLAYRFRHQSEDVYPRDPNEYWKFKTPFPGSSELEIGTQDPCTKVYPKGVWRMPTDGEVDNLVNQNGRTDNTKFAEFQASGVASPYPSNKLRINKIGYLHLIGQMFGVTEDGDNAYLYSSKARTLIGGLFGGVYMFKASNIKQYIITGEKVWGEWSASSWGGRVNVRCVRN
ncbi:hypothetical protein GCM10022216_22330 [Sphingobacterium kyonggiense]|uniref:Fimbrillin-like protein n=1 Tax=Sphingobacterium kyonggiense TaxID=714075 RepID=A0ABP7YVE6_9SPHI